MIKINKFIDKINAENTLFLNNAIECLKKGEDLNGLPLTPDSLTALAYEIHMKYEISDELIFTIAEASCPKPSHKQAIEMLAEKENILDFVYNEFLTHDAKWISKSATLINQTIDKVFDKMLDERNSQEQHYD